MPSKALYDIHTIYHIQNSDKLYFVGIFKYKVSLKEKEKYIKFTLCISLYAFYPMHFTLRFSPYACHSMNFTL